MDCRESFKGNLSLGVTFFQELCLTSAANMIERHITSETNDFIRGFVLVFAAESRGLSLSRQLLFENFS